MARSVGRTAKAGRLTVPQHLSAICCVEPGNDLHQGGLACTVLAHEKMHFASRNGEVAASQCRHAAEAFLDAFQFKKHERPHFERSQRSCNKICCECLKTVTILSFPEGRK